MKNIILGLLFGGLLSACASSGVNSIDAEQPVEIFYAKVLKTEPVQFDSKADEAALIGGISGVVDNSHGDSEDMIAGGFAGAILSALFTSIEEGGSKGLLVSLQTNDQQQFDIATKNTRIKTNQCLRIIQGFDLALEAVGSEYCQ